MTRGTTGTETNGAETIDPKERQFRSHAGRVSRQASVFFTGTLFTAFAGYLFKVYVARVVGAEALGVYALGLQVVGFAALFATLGLPETTARFVAVYRGTGRRAEVRRLFLRSLAFLLPATAVLAAALVLGRHLLAERVFGVPELATYLPAFALLLPTGALIKLCGQFLRGHQEVARRTVVTHFVQLPAKIVVTVALFGFGWRLPAYVAGEVAGQLLTVALLAVLALRFLPARTAGPPPRLGREVAAYAASVTGLGFLRFFASRVDVLLVGVFLTSDRVGIFSIAVATAAFVPTLLTSLNSIFGPMIAHLHARGETPMLERLLRTTTKWCLGLTWPLATTLIFFAPVMMGFFGNDFRAGGTALAWIVAGQLVNVGVGAVGNLLMMSGHQRLELMGTGLSALLTVTLDLLLIPRWGIAGAGIAAAASLGVANLWRLWMVRRFLAISPYHRRSWRLAPPIVLATAATVGVRFLAPGAVPPLAAFLLALAASYGVLLLSAALLALDEDDRLILDAVRERVGGWLGGSRR